FAHREQKKGLVLIVDARHKPTGDDVTMMDFARYYEIPLCVVVTKMDKLKASQRQKQLKVIRETLALNHDEPLFPFSSEKRMGMDAIWKYLIPIFES
ncbi:MAG: GTP-binding protein, partial [Longicatena sp.]